MNTPDPVDLVSAAAPKSDQVNAEDLLSGPRVVTIERVTKGSAEQPVQIHLTEFPGRAYRPGKSMIRVLINAWGVDSTAYVGRRLMIYRDPEIRFGPDLVGGIRISKMSHIGKKLTLALTVTRGKRKPFVVEPLPDGPPLVTDAQADEIAAGMETAADRAALDSIGAQLKSFDLGQHRTRLVQLWKERANAIGKREAPPQGDIQDAPADYYTDVPPDPEA